MKKYLFFALLISIIFQTPSFASQKAELLIPATKKQVIDSLTNIMLSKDFAIKTVNDYQAEYFKAAGDWRFQAVYGNVQSRVSYNFLETPEGIKVIANMGLVENPGTAFEKMSDLSFDSNAKTDAMNLLNQVKASIH